MSNPRAAKGRAKPPAAAEPAAPVAHLLREIHFALRAAFDEALRPRGRTLRQVGVLAALKQSPGLSNAELARRFQMTPQSMIELLVALESAGLVTRERHPDGGRVLQAQLTPAGASQLRACRSVMGETEALLLAGLSRDDQRQLRELLERWVASLGNNRSRRVPSSGTRDDARLPVLTDERG